MTTKQPEALRLADIVERLNVGVHSQAIAEEYTAAARELRRLHAENEAMKKDAARYKWLREQHWSSNGMCVAAKSENVRLGSYCPSGEFLDSEIDAALAAQAKKDK